MGLPEGFPRTLDECVDAMTLLQLARDCELGISAGGRGVVDTDYLGWTWIGNDSAVMLALLTESGHLELSGAETVCIEGENEAFTINGLAPTADGMDLLDRLDTFRPHHFPQEG